MNEEKCNEANSCREAMEKKPCVLQVFSYGGGLEKCEDCDEWKKEVSAMGADGVLQEELKEGKVDCLELEGADGMLQECLKESKVDCLELEDADHENSVDELRDMVTHMESKKRLCFGYEGDNIRGARLNEVYNFYGFTNMNAGLLGMDAQYSLGCVEDKAWFMSELGDALDCWLNAGALNVNTSAANTWFHDEGPLAGMFSKGVYHEEETSFWWQHDSNPEFFSREYEI